MKINKLLFIKYKLLFILFLLLFLAISKGQSQILNLDIETVERGGKIWMTKPIDVCYYTNGDKITEAKSQEDWKKCGEKKLGCWFRSIDVFGNKANTYYNWYAINDKRGFCPKGFHVQNLDESKIMKEYDLKIRGDECEVSEDGLLNCENEFHCIWIGEKNINCDILGNANYLPYQCIEAYALFNGQAGSPIPSVLILLNMNCGLIVRCIKDK